MLLLLFCFDLIPVLLSASCEALCDVGFEKCYTNKLFIHYLLLVFLQKLLPSIFLPLLPSFPPPTSSLPRGYSARRPTLAPAHPICPAQLHLPRLFWLLASHLSHLHPSSPPPNPLPYPAHGYSLAGPAAQWCPVINESFHTQGLSWPRGRGGAVGTAAFLMSVCSHLRWRWGRREGCRDLGNKVEMVEEKRKQRNGGKYRIGLNFWQFVFLENLVR